MEKLIYRQSYLHQSFFKIFLITLSILGMVYVSKYFIILIPYISYLFLKNHLTTIEFGEDRLVYTPFTITGENGNVSKVYYNTMTDLTIHELTLLERMVGIRDIHVEYKDNSTGGGYDAAIFIENFHLECTNTLDEIWNNEMSQREYTRIS
ncbi:hypothetical protein HOG47_08550 [archaeon]|jgi:hypothetical protein|nr:hypothetical protein [archaeon]